MPPAAQPPQPPDPSPADAAAPDAAALGVPPDRRPEQATPPPAAPSPGASSRGADGEQPLPRVKAKPTGRADPAHQQRSVAALFLALLSLFGVLGLSNFQRGVFIVTFALVAGVMAIWLAGTAIRRARRGGTAGPRGSVVAVAIGGVGVLISGILLAGFALFGQQASTFSRCLSGANTVVAQQACRTQFARAIEHATR